MANQGMTSERPLPEITPATEPFWAAAKRRELVMQRCGQCGVYRFPPEVACAACGSREAQWAPVSGRGNLYTWTVAYPPLLPYFAERAPWPIAVVELDEGPRLITQLVGIEVADYTIGMRLQVDFEDVDDETALPVFRRSS